MRVGVGVLLLASALADDANETACRALGFAPSLLCSSCTKLSEFVGAGDALFHECRGCCTEDFSNAGIVYSRAVLDVTYTQGAPPNLFMQDVSGATLDEVSIANWKVEHIEEYLSEKLDSA
ncbi:hypothetical protein AB1Y20_023693 [Prymnesium parvum]|uniref:Selenoprotein F n=1 Tax=Prymnesium parvum TaxID=97485 RepID=A0AB34JGZ4_PRYPA